MSKSILLVEDETDIGLIISRFLIAQGFLVDYAETIAAAREFINGKKYALYVLDINLPDGSGTDLIAEIDSDTDQSKIVIISAYESYLDNAAEQDMKVDAFLKKPFSKTQIVDLVNSLI